MGCPQPVTPRRTAGHTGQPGIPDSRAYRAAGHTGQPGSRAYRAAGHTGQPGIPGSRAAGQPGIPGSRTAGHTGQPGIPGSRAYRAAGHTGQPGIPHPHARSPTALAADAAGAAPNLGVLYDAVACRHAPRSSEPASGAAEAGVGRSLTPYAPGHARGAPPAPRRGCRIAPRERGALMRGCGGRAPSGAARGGQDSVRLPYSPRVPPACAVGARPPPRGPCRRPTALAADTAGAASNLGVLYTAVACRCASRFTEAASGAAEAGRWAVPQPQRGPALRVACRQGCRVGAGSRRCRVEGFLKAAAGGSRRVRRAAGQRGAAGHSRRAYRPHVRWAPARRPAAKPAAQPRSQQTPLARPQTWAFCTMRSRAVTRLAPAHLPAALLKLVLGGPQP